MSTKEYPRKVRVAAQLQAELATLIREQLSDPRVVGVTVTEVNVSPDMQNARVSVSLLGSDERLKDAVKGLARAAGKLRHDLGARLRMRYVPHLHFVADHALREGDRISAMIRAAVSSDAQNSDSES